MKTTLVLASLLALLAVPAVASANHNFCHNEPGEDVYLGIVGVDGPPLDGNGEQVCVGGDDDFYQVTTTPPAGVGVVIRLCFASNDAYGACNEPMGNEIILDYTGVSIFCTTTLSACVWVNGIRI